MAISTSCLAAKAPVHPSGSAWCLQTQANRARVVGWSECCSSTIGGKAGVSNRASVRDGKLDTLWAESWLGGSTPRSARSCSAVSVVNDAAEALTEDKSSDPAAADKCVLVAGATGGVGQLVVAALLERGNRVRALVRDAGKARSLFGDTFQRLEIHVGDLRQPEQLSQGLFEGVTHVICCTGTTAFPSKRWDGDNGPQNTDWIGVRNLIATVPSSVRKVVLVSSIGVTKYNQLPWNIMNLFGVLNYKRQAEMFLESSGLPYTIIRAGRLIDGPYTAYDLATLLQATSGTKRAVKVGQGDKLVGDASRIVVAEACVQALDLDTTTGQVYEVNSVEGDGPGKDAATWEQLFRSAHH